MKIQPDLIIHHCKILDFSHPGFYRHTALAVYKNRIAISGDNDGIRSLAGSATRQLHGRSQWLLPAFIDAHTHLTGYAARKVQVNLSGCRTFEQCLQKIKEKIEQTPEGEWITGGGWDKNFWGGGFPDKSVLDAISTRHFIALDSKDWHSLWVNSLVLQRCGITNNKADPMGGEILRDSRTGEPTGILKEKARAPVFSAMPIPSLQQYETALEETFREFYRMGITAVGSMETPAEISLYQQLHQMQKLGLRIFYYFPLKFLDQALELQLHAGLGDDFLRICGVKMFADGALGSQTAAMLENFENLNHCGIETLSKMELDENINKCIRNHIACAIHAIGDRANRNVLQIFSKYSEESRARQLRHRIEHAQLLHPDDIPLFAHNQIIASMQPIHLAADIPNIEKYWGKRGRYAYAFNSLHSSGAILAFGSDTPIEDFNPWKALYSAVERKEGCQPNQPVFYPEEQFPLPEALKAYTTGSAYAAGMEHSLGSLTPGKLADFILINRNIFNEPPEALLDTRVLLTVLDGKMVYQAEDF